MKQQTNLYFATASGILLWAAWPVSPFTFLVFIALVPLLWLESIVESRKKFLGLTYITMFIWNVATTWWIWNASPPGAVAAFLANSFLMCLPWLGYKIVKEKLGTLPGFVALIAFWMSFEYIHLQDWGLSWPWLTLGNVFATNTEWIQWYSYTGTSGGTFWILTSNLLIFSLLSEYQQNGRSRNYFIKLFSWLFVLVFPSMLYNKLTAKNKTETVDQKNIVVVQPNIDPYEKIAAGSFEAQLQKLITLSEKETDSTTALVIWPETALYMGNGIDENQLKENYFLNPVWAFLQRHPNTTLFTGIESFRQVDQPTKYSREYDGHYFESYNAGVLVDSNGAHSFYHKTMLVPGVETLPWFLKFIDSWFEKFGGTTAGYAKQKERTVLVEKNGYKIAPSICYESIYGEFMSRYIRNGANLICIITNDGWWKNTPGHKQHVNYARLRAIETRTWVARSANTGISCFIDPEGNIINPQSYNTAATIHYSITTGNHQKTFFVRYGDLLSQIMTGISLLLIGWILFLKIRSTFFKKKFPSLQP